MVPSPLQKTITRLWHNGKPHAGYAEACASATDQVNAKLLSRARAD
jgi:hypothetical protein